MENAAIPLDTLIPLKIAYKPTGIPRATLYRWATKGVFPVYLIDGERCAHIGDILEADETRREKKNTNTRVRL